MKKSILLFCFLSILSTFLSYAQSEIDVLGNEVSIIDGDITPNIIDHTNFGTQSSCIGTITRTYKIKNIGSSVLNITAINISGTGALAYTLSGISLPVALVASDSITFNIIFDPTANIVYNASIAIANSDADENPYNFDITGTGAESEINIKGNNISISDGSTATSTTNFTNMGGVCINTFVNQKTFKIFNTGVAPLTIGSINFTGTHAALFNVVSAPTTVLTGDSASLVIGLSSFTTSGTKTATININTNDCDESIYNFNLQGAVNPLPIVSIFGTTPICQGDTSLLTGSSGGSSQWYRYGVPIPGATTNTYHATLPGVYNMTKTNLNGCVDSSLTSFVLVANPLPSISVGSSSSSICIGNSSTIFATGANSYLWNPGAINNDTIIVSPTTTTTYTVTGISTVGCQNIATTTVTVNNLPIVNASASNTSICIGNATNLVATGTATSYIWNPGAISGTSLTVSPSASTNYILSGTNASGCINYDTISIIVNTYPTVGISDSPSGGEICLGTALTLSGTGAISYTWSGGVINGATFIPTSSGTYTVIGTNDVCNDTAIYNLIINPLPSISISALPNDSVCSNELVTLTASGTPTIIWSDAISNAIPFIANTTNTYIALGTDINGCSNSDSIAITIVPINLTYSVFPNDTICEGTAITLNGSGGINLHWSDGISNGISFTPTNTNLYYLSGENNFGCEDSIEVIVSVNPNPIVNLGSDITTSTTITLDAGNVGSSYIWNTLETTQTIIVDSTNSYFVTVMDENGCVDSDTIVVTFNIGLNEEANSTCYIYPNPSNGKFNIQMSNINENVVVSIFDVKGNLVFSKELISYNNNIQSDIHLIDLLDGVYILQVSNRKFVQQVKLIVQH